MGNLKFEDIDEWTPSSISIVDEPSHPCCHFEVYHDDEEYVKKSIEVNEGEMMVENPQNQEQEPMVQAPVSFFEKLLGRTVGKAVEDEVPKPPVKEEKSDSNLEARIAALEEKVAKLEKEKEKPEDKEEKEPTPGAVTKSEGESSEAEATTETEEAEEKIIDENEVVAKSKSIDPDTVAPSATSEKSLVERAGRNANGMSW